MAKAQPKFSDPVAKSEFNFLRAAGTHEKVLDLRPPFELFAVNLGHRRGEFAVAAKLLLAECKHGAN